MRTGERHGLRRGAVHRTLSCVAGGVPTHPIRSTTAFLGTSLLGLVAAASLGVGSASAHPSPSGKGAERTVSLSVDLDELNGSNASGTVTATFRNQRIQSIDVHAHGLTPDAPQAQRIHYGHEALNECPPAALDAHDDGRINTVEGIPTYGPEGGLRLLANLVGEQLGTGVINRVPFSGQEVTHLERAAGTPGSPMRAGLPMSASHRPVSPAPVNAASARLSPRTRNKMAQAVWPDRKAADRPSEHGPTEPPSHDRNGIVRLGRHCCGAIAAHPN